MPLSHQDIATIAGDLVAGLDRNGLPAQGAIGDLTTAIENGRFLQHLDSMTGTGATKALLDRAPQSVTAINEAVQDRYYGGEFEYSATSQTPALVAVGFLLDLIASGE